MNVHKKFFIIFAILLFSSFVSANGGVIQGNSISDSFNGLKATVSPHSCWFKECELTVETENLTSNAVSFTATGSFDIKDLDPFSNFSFSHVQSPVMGYAWEPFNCLGTVQELNQRLSCVVVQLLDSNEGDGEELGPFAPVQFPSIADSVPMSETRLRSGSWEVRRLVEVSPGRLTVEETSVKIVNDKMTRTSGTISLGPFEKKSFKVTYHPNTIRGKWDLNFSNGLFIDPWFDNSFLYKMPIRVRNLDGYADTNVAVYVDVNIDSNAFFWSHVLNRDLNDIIFVDESETTQLSFFQITPHPKDSNKVLFIVNLPTSSDQNIFIYFANAVKTTSSSSCTWLTFCDTFEAGNMSKWNTSSGVIAVNSFSYDKNWSARIDINSGSPATSYTNGSASTWSMGGMFWVPASGWGGTDPNSNFGLSMNSATGNRISFEGAGDITAYRSPALGTWTGGNWYFLRMDKNASGSGSSDLYFYDANGQWKGKLLNHAYTTGNASFGITTEIYSPNASVAYADNVVMTKSYETSLTFYNVATGSGTLVANFDSNHNPATLDPENGINTIFIRFTDLSSPNIGGNLTGWAWKVNGVQVSNDQNLVYPFSAVGDYNIHLDVNDSNGGRGAFDLNQLVVEVLQGLDFNVNYNFATSLTKVDLNGFVTSGTVTSWIWSFPNSADANLSGQNVQKDYNTTYDARTCLTGTSSNGSMKTVCKDLVVYNFYFVNDLNGQVMKNSSEWLLNDINSARVYFYDKNRTLNLTDLNQVRFGVIGAPDTQILVVLSYNNEAGDEITYDFDLDILDSNSVGICYTDLQIFNRQVILSASKRGVIMKNANNWPCYRLAARTKYALEDAFIVPAYTVNQGYYLYVGEGANRVLLALVNGGVPSTINIDLLYFRENQAAVEAYGEELVISRVLTAGNQDTNTFQIYYENIMGANSGATFNFYQDENLLFTYTDTNNPNRVLIFWDTSTYDLNVSALRVVATLTRVDGSVDNITRWFIQNNKRWVFPLGVGLLFAFVVLLTGLTLLAIRFTFGWMGILTSLIALGILTFTEPSWLTFLGQVICFGSLFFIGLVFKDEYARLS